MTFADFWPKLTAPQQNFEKFFLKTQSLHSYKRIVLFSNSDGVDWFKKFTLREINIPDVLYYDSMWGGHKSLMLN